MSKIRIALFRGYSQPLVPIMFSGYNFSDKSTIEFRVELAELMENLETNSTSLLDGIAKVKDGEALYIKCNDDLDTVYFVKDKQLNLVDVTTEEIDTKRPWRIKPEDGDEYVETLVSIKVVNEKYNMCTW